MRWPIVVLLSFVCVTSLRTESQAASQRRLSQLPQYFRAFQSREDKESFTRVVLRNGLTVLIEEYPLDPLVAVVTYVKASYSQEGANSRGVSRLLEQLYLYRSEVASQMKSLGAILNVTGTYDSTFFSSLGPAENALKILELHADLLQDPQIPSSEIAPEMEILLEEERRQLELPEVFAKQKLLALIYPDDPRTRRFSISQSLATPKETDAARQRLVSFHKAYYHPKNVILTVSGQVRREQILEKLVELYGSMRSSKGAQKTSTKSPSVESSIDKTSFQYLHLRGDVQRPYVILAYRVPGQRHDDYLPLVLLSYILGQGRGALLQQSVGDENDSGTAVEVKLEAFDQKGTFFFFLNPGAGNVDRAEVRVLAQLEALRRRGIPISQLDRAKALLLKDHYKRLQSLEQRAYSLSIYEASGEYLKRDGWVQLLKTVTEKQIARLLDRYFRDSNLSLLEYFPRDAEPRTFTAETLLETLQLLVGAVLDQQASSIDAPQISQEKSTFQIRDFSPNYLKYDFKKTSILRGPIIYFQEEHALPLVQVGFFFPGGRINESAKNVGITELMLRALLRNRISQEESKSWSELEQLGVEVNVVNDMDFFGFLATALSSHVNEVFAALLDWTRRPDLEEDDLKWARQEVLALLGRQKDGFSQLLESTRRRVFKKHPYGWNRYGAAETVSKFTLDSVQAWMASRIERVHPLIVIRGDVEGTSFLQDFISRLSDSKYEIREPVERQIEEEKTDKRNSMPKTIFEAQNGEVMVAFAGPAKGTREEIILNVLESVLVGPSGILTVSLRNKANLVRRVQLFHQAGLNGGAIFSYLVSSEGKEEVARQELLKQLDHLTRVPLPRDEFFGALVGAITKFHLREQQGQDYLVQLSRNLLAGAGVDYMQEYLSTVKNIRADDLTYVAKQYFGQSQEPQSTDN